MVRYKGECYISQ